MPKYCDSKQLELSWGGWAWAEQSPELDCLRDARLLMTASTTATRRDHVITTSTPIKFQSQFDPVARITMYFRNGKRLNIHDLTSRIETLESDSKISQQFLKDNYIMELPKSKNWESLLTMIYSICNGVSSKFERDPDEKTELAHEALNYLVEKKLKRGKLNYTPGKAPVFNLMTTAIIRVMYSLKNKSNKNRENITKLGINIINKANLPKTRSLAIAATMEYDRCKQY